MRSLIPTISMCDVFSAAALKTSLPILPNPLMPTLIAINTPPDSKKVYNMIDSKITSDAKQSKVTRLII
ncbi:hypothetical protein R80B4_02637 [Fibrobacteres bacterium R8-0-B4]